MPVLGIRIGVPGIIGAKALAPFVPIAGAAVDINFATGQSYPTAQATLIDGSLTTPLGLLASTLLGASVGILLRLKVGAALVGWITFTGGSQTNAMFGVTDTTVRTRDNFAVPVNLVATAGSGGFSSVACKIFAGFDATGRAIIMNDGVIATDAQAPSGAPTGCSFTNFASAVDRLTVFASRPTNVAGKALTVLGP